jgi:hypothetical protein
VQESDETESQSEVEKERVPVARVREEWIVCGLGQSVGHVKTVAGCDGCEVDPEVK